MSLTKVKASNITLTTAAASSNDTTPATTQYVTTAINNLIDGAPATLNTLDEIAAALNDDAALNTTLTNAIAAKLPLAGGTLTGTLTTPTLITGAYGASGSAGDGFRLNSTDLYGQVDSSDKVRIAVAGNSFFNGGNVGIGTTGPFAKSHIKYTGYDATVTPYSPYGAIQLIEGAAVADNNWGHLVITDTATGSGNGGSIRFATGASNALNPFAGIQGDAEGTSYGGLGFYTRASGGTATERMRIRSDGTTTIGRAITPTYDNDIGYPLHIQAQSGNQTYLAISVPGAASGDTGLVLGHDGTGTRITNREADPMIFGISSSEKMRISGAGNVGIGNTDPLRALLHVGGNGIAVNTTRDVSKTAILRTSGTGNYSTSGNGSAAHALTLMRGSNAADGDQVGLSFVLDDGGWSATSEIMAEVEQASSANTRLNFKTWNASGSMRTTQMITSEGQVVKPYQSAFVAVRDQAQSIAVNQNVVFNNAYKNVGGDYNTSNGSYMAPISGFYFFSYTILIITTTTFHIDHYLRTSNHSFIGGMPGRIEYQAAGSGTWGDGYIGFGHAQTVYMDAGDTAHVDFSELGGATRTIYGNATNNWTKFTGYFLG